MSVTSAGLVGLLIDQILVQPGQRSTVQQLREKISASDLHIRKLQVCHSTHSSTRI